MKGWQLRSIIKKIDALTDKWVDENKRHEVAVEQIKAEIAKIQKECPHTITDYYPDASGNNDSTTECALCQSYEGKNGEWYNHIHL